LKKLKEENREKQIIIKDLSNNIEDVTKKKDFEEKYISQKNLFETQETQET
tara:strand:- start:121 stop:273 length:153 start_codon:yes stop_codon:yes gene_type:complete